MMKKKKKQSYTTHHRPGKRDGEGRGYAVVASLNRLDIEKETQLCRCRQVITVGGGIPVFVKVVQKPCGYR